MGPRRTRPSTTWLIFAIHLYRNLLSQFMLGSCKFYPSCSRYGEEAIRKYGAWSGSGLVLARIFRCHPFSAGGVDLVP